MEQEILQLKQRIYELEKRQELFLLGKEYHLTRKDVRVGSTNFKVGFFGKDPIAQPSSTGTIVGHDTSPGGATVAHANTFTGNVGSTAYTIGDIIKHLKNLGILAQ